MTSITINSSIPSTPQGAPCVEKRLELSDRDLNNNIKKILPAVINTAKKSYKPFVYRCLFCKGFEKILQCKLKPNQFPSKNDLICVNLAANALAAIGYATLSPIAIPIDVIYAIGSRVIQGLKNCTEASRSPPPQRPAAASPTVVPPPPPIVAQETIE